MGVADRICQTRHVPSFHAFPVPAVTLSSEALAAVFLSPGPHENVSSRQGLPNSWHAAVTAFQISLHLSPDPRLYIVKNIYIYTYLTVYELPLLANNSASGTFMHKSGAVRSVDWIFIIGGAGLAVTVRVRDIGQNVLQYSLQTGSSSSPVTAKLPSLSHSWRRPLLEI